MTNAGLSGMNGRMINTRTRMIISIRYKYHQLSSFPSTLGIARTEQISVPPCAIVPVIILIKPRHC